MVFASVHSQVGNTNTVTDTTAGASQVENDKRAGDSETSLA